MCLVLTPDWEIVQIHLVPVVILDSIFERLQLVLGHDDGTIFGFGNVR